MWGAAVCIPSLLLITTVAQRLLHRNKQVFAGRLPAWVVNHMPSRYFGEDALCFPPSLSPFTHILTPPHTHIEWRWLEEHGRRFGRDDARQSRRLGLCRHAAGKNVHAVLYTHCDKIAKMTNVPHAVIACACNIDSFERFALARKLAPCAILVVSSSPARRSHQEPDRRSKGWDEDGDGGILSPKLPQVIMCKAVVCMNVPSTICVSLVCTRRLLSPSLSLAISLSL